MSKGVMVFIFVRKAFYSIVPSTDVSGERIRGDGIIGLPSTAPQLEHASFWFDIKLTCSCNLSKVDFWPMNHRASYALS